MPTLDEVMDNLGEPMDFVEYRIKDDDDDKGQGNERANARILIDSDIDGKLENIAGPSGTVHADVESAVLSGNSLSSSVAAVDIIAITGFENQE